MTTTTVRTTEQAEPRAKKTDVTSKSNAGYENVVVLWDDANMDGVLMNILNTARLDADNGIDKKRVVTGIRELRKWDRRHIHPFIFKAIPSGQPADWPYGSHLRQAGITPVWVQGETGEEADDQAILSTLRELRDWSADVLLLSHDGGYAEQLEQLAQDPKRCVGVVGFREELSKGYYKLMRRGQITIYDLEDDMRIFDRPLPRTRETVVSPDEFDPAALLSGRLGGALKKRGELPPKKTLADLFRERGLEIPTRKDREEVWVQNTIYNRLPEDKSRLRTITAASSN